MNFQRTLRTAVAVSALGLCGAGLVDVMNRSEAGTVIVEQLYRFEETVLDAPLVLTADSETSNGPAATPLAAARRGFTAMLRGDFDRWYAGLEPTTANEMLDLPAGAEPSPAAIAALKKRRGQAWAQFLAGVSIHVVAVCDATRFSQVAFEMRRAEADAERSPLGKRQIDAEFDENGVWRDTLRFVKSAKDDTWRQTNGFSEHPIALLWWSGRDRIQVLAEDQ